MRSLPVAALLAIGVAICACASESSSDPDADLGGVFLDGGADRFPTDIPRDLPADATVDAPHGLDAPADVMPGELTFTDAALSSAAVLYAVATDVDSFGLRTTTSDGNGAVSVVPLWDGLVDLDILYLSGLQDYLPVRADRPQRTTDQLSAFQGIRLPGGLGTLYYVHRKLLGTSGLLVVDPTGEMNMVLEVPGIYSDTLANRIGLSGDGAVGAAIVTKSSLVLFRTDGSTFDNGQSWIDITGVHGNLELSPHSLTLVGGWLYCVGRDADDKAQLLRALLDGSTTLEAVPLEKSPESIADQMAVSADGSRVALAAGTGESSRHLYILTPQSGQAVIVTASPGQLGPRGEHWGNLEGQLALSPSGNRVAYVSRMEGIAEVLVSDTSAGGNTVTVTEDTRFSPGVEVFSNLFFSDEDNLLFTAGLSAIQMDLYRWDCTKEQAINLTGYGTTKVPFSGYGKMQPMGAWLSPNNMWLYWIEDQSFSGDTNIRGLDLGSFAVVDITSGVRVKTSASVVAACPDGEHMYFVADSDPTPPIKDQIWSFDQNQATKAVKRTSMSPTPGAYWFVFDLELSGDCSRLAWTAGGASSLRNLWVLDTAGPAPARQVTLTPLYMSPSFAFTPDSETLVFSSGGYDDSMTLKAVHALGSGTTTLDPAAGHVHLFAVD